MGAHGSLTMQVNFHMLKYGRQRLLNMYANTQPIIIL